MHYKSRKETLGITNLNIDLHVQDWDWSKNFESQFHKKFWYEFDCRGQILCLIFFFLEGNYVQYTIKFIHVI